ncbi:MAG: hypothetical protein NTV58_17550 [Deltaproteobacteria bacterium]|nr:hypothetical protein [Deltaproteobacteria bacterium]
MLLNEIDRLRLLKDLIAHIAKMDVKAQGDLAVHWMNTLSNQRRRKEDADEVLTRMDRVLYATPAMETWAEGRLIGTGMEIKPLEMAIEWAHITHQDPRLASAYVRDMQKIKNRLQLRIRRTTTPVRKSGMPIQPRPRYKMTPRQQAKRKAAITKNRLKKAAEAKGWEDAAAAHKEEQRKEQERDQTPTPSPLS